MASRTAATKAGKRAARNPLRRFAAGHVPSGAAPAVKKNAKKNYRYVYTTGPFCLPQSTHSIDWGLLNNDTVTRTVRVTVFKCWLGAAKTAEPPGPLVFNVPPKQATHNANAAVGGFFYEIQVETDSQRVFPYAAAWPGSIGDPLPGSVVKSAEFIRRLA